MESIDEIEDFLKKETEKIDKEFLGKLKNIKNKQGKQEAEKNYREKLRQVRERYEKEFVKCLKAKEKIKSKNEPFKKEQGTTKKQKEEKLKLSWKENLSLKSELTEFRFKIKTKNFFRKIMPDFLVLSYLKMNLKIKRLFSSIRKNVSNELSKIRYKITLLTKSLAEKLKRASLQLYSRSKRLFSLIAKVASKIRKKKEEKTETKKEKTEEEKLIEKILNKKE